ncbi:efflux RND transporter permease subunit [Rheinheimera sp. UJ63]|uniref:efflux RND transporter permease subunit n=1 Tax=Rheinheimera sp. UJ63 TaxID=2910157 RepID=UPI001F18491E|nr:CusA/CzcA family heavy metal efflux RND transporter [Rheinheimera sp. UJ63]MCF4010533.1 CusA/CzcA family heavy metal efflux RND transporter [Rheinheimera sp. UJ63]
MAALLRFILTQKLFVLALTALVIALAVQAWQRLPIDAFPDISPTQVKLIIRAPGMTTAEVEAQITQPIETELLGIPNQSILRSTTKYGITSITIDFTEGTDIYWARQQVSERLAGVWGSLPDIAEGGLAPMSTPLSEIFMFSYNNPNLSLTERRHVLDWQIRPLLRTVPGVAEVATMGGYVQTYEFNPDLVRLQQAGISLEHLISWLQQQHMNGSVGRINSGTNTLVIRTEGKLTDAFDLSQLTIADANGNPITLAQLGEVSLGHLARFGGVTHNGKETAQAMIIALKGANTSEVVAAVKAKLDQISMTLPEGSELNVFYDRATLIETAVSTILEALFAAVLLVIVVLFIFLADVRAALVVAIAIPLAVAITFLAMDQVGLTANLMSLGGIVIAIGMLVDAAVVVVENIVSQGQQLRHAPVAHRVYRATLAVAKPVIAGTAIVIIVFAPLLMLTGLEGKLFSPVAMTIVFAMLASLVIALCVIPVLAVSLIKVSDKPAPKFLQWLLQRYQHALTKVIQRPAPWLIMALLLVMGTGLTASFVGKTFMPVMDEGDLIVQLEKHPDVSLSESLAVDGQISQRLLRDVAEIKQIVARIGSDELGMDPMGLNETDMFMQLHPATTWQVSSKEALTEKIRTILQEYPGINFNFTQPIQMRVSEMLTGTSGDVAVKVFGDDVATLSHLAQSIAHTTEQMSGSVDVQTTIIDGGEFVNVRLRPEVAARYQLTTEELSRRLRIFVDGLQVGEITNGKIKTPLLFSSSQQPNQVSYLEQLATLPVSLPNGSVVALASVATIETQFGPSLIERENGSRFAVVTSNVSGRDIVSFVEELKQQIGQAVSLPSGYTIEYGGEFENQARATNNLLMIVPVVLLVIVLILFTTFRSLAIAGLVYANIPFALMGGVLALFISGEYLSVPASVGFIALLGVAVLNGVVMLSHFQSIDERYNDIKELVIAGAGDRLRAILMTATTAMLGLIPLALATGPGAEIQRPLAIVVIGGLITSTLTTLFLLPLMYARLRGRHDRT